MRKLFVLLTMVIGLSFGVNGVRAEDCPFTWEDVKEEMAYTWGKCPATDQLVSLIKCHRFVICDRKDSSITCLPPNLRPEIVNGEERQESLDIKWVAIKVHESYTECHVKRWWVNDKPAFLTRNDIKCIVYDVKKLIRNIPNAHPACAGWTNWTE